jgi:hypothetical protein
MSFDARLLNGLNVLAAIGEAGNFVRAREALGLTQSGVSRAKHVSNRNWGTQRYLSDIALDRHSQGLTRRI